MSVSVLPFRAAALGAALLAGALAGGCTPLRSHQGYIIDTDLVNSVQPGVDTRASVAQVLGRPTLASQFGTGDWFYIARDARNLNFQKPKVRDQITLRISFDQAGTVRSVTRMGVDQVASVDMYGKTTPTLGKKRGFFEDLFGNIGTVGAAGAGSGGGADRTQP